MKLLTESLRAKLLDNGLQSNAASDLDSEPPDHYPVVKLFDPAGAATWLLTEIDPDDHDRAFGLCDLGVGFPELGFVSLDELARLRSRFGGLGMERDRAFLANKPLSAYTQAALFADRIVT